MKIKLLFIFLAGILTSQLYVNYSALWSNYHAKTNPDVYHRSRIFQLSAGSAVSRALQVFAELNIADYLSEEKPQIINQEFADTLECNQDMLYRLLRMLAAHGIVKEKKEGFYLTNLGGYIRTDHPATLINFLKMEDQSRWYAYGQLLETIKTGTASFNLTFNKSYFDFIKGYPKLQERFNKGMSDISYQENNNIIKALPIKSEQSIVDIGGGTGTLLLALKAYYKPLIKEALVIDYNPLSNDQQALLKNNDINFYKGSFFDSNSSMHNKDNYILKRILHNWDDQSCIAILQQCKKAMKPTSRLYIIDSIIPAGNKYHISKDIDIMMMALFGGKERTKKQIVGLLRAADLKLISFKPIRSSMLYLIEVQCT